MWVCAQEPPGSRQGEREEEGKRKVFCVKLTVSNVFLNNSCASRRKWLQDRNWVCRNLFFVIE